MGKYAFLFQPASVTRADSQQGKIEVGERLSLPVLSLGTAHLLANVLVKTERFYRILKK